MALVVTAVPVVPACGGQRAWYNGTTGTTGVAGGGGGAVPATRSVPPNVLTV